MRQDTRTLKQWQYKIFILCWLAYALVYFGRVNLSISMLELENYFQVDKAKVGLLGSAFFYTYAMGQLVNGTISDKISSRWFIFTGLFLSGICNILLPFTSQFSFSIILWGLNGIGQSMLWVNIIKTMGLWFKPHQYNRVVVALNTSIVLGYLMAWGGGGMLLRFFSWEKTFLIPGIVLVAFSVLWLILVRNSPESVGLQLEDNNDRGHSPATYEGHGKPIPLKQLLFSTGLIFIIVVCIAQGMIKESIGIWSPTILSDMYKISMSDASRYILLIPFMNLLGILFAGVLNAWCKQKEKLTIMILLTMSIAVFLILQFLGQYGVVIGVLGISIASGLMFGINTMLLGVIPIRYSQYGRAAMVTGILDFSAYLGAGLASVLVGKILDGKSGVNRTFIIWNAIALFAIVFLMIPAFKKYKYKKHKV